MPRRLAARLTRTAAVLAMALSAAGGLVVGACSSDDGGPGTDAAAATDDVTFAYVIPPGAGTALDAGTPLEILPARLEAAVGDVIEIVNEDDRGHLIGPFFVGAHETLRQRFSSPGEYIGECTVHPSGQIVVEVT